MTFELVKNLDASHSSDINHYIRTREHEEDNNK